MKRRRRRMGQSASSADGQGCSGLPVAVIEEIILNLPAEQALCVCRLVCREWKAVVDSASFWREKCRREGLKPRTTDRKTRDWQVFYWLSKKRRNLLRNPKAEENYRGWDIIENGGDKWHIEGMFVPHPDETVTKCFVTSYFPCMKRQLINLQKEGYSLALLDEMQPDIIISDWYAPRWDCGSKYEICVELLNHKKAAIQTFRPEPVTFPQWNDQQWNQMTHVFSDYGPGVRYVRFTHGGKDTQFWAGWYGIRVTNSSVEIYPAEEA
ncbi:F-box only protein 6-like isoform X1 [Pygocentrus nattereri]|uniref:F-box domain-containing protein n=1 Tax=Pygocentrus nattereri TaxID=42514 RepID=A0A3B4E4J6_PYGNA|nr:F-box only protein 6-like isoform X1 [Pygocentrus nattereri]